MFQDHLHYTQRLLTFSLGTERLHRKRRANREYKAHLKKETIVCLLDNLQNR